MRLVSTFLVGLLLATSGVLEQPAQADEVVYVDTCREVRDFFLEIRPVYYQVRQDGIDAGEEISRQLGSRPNRSLIRRNAAREARNYTMDFLEQVAALGWPTARDRTLRRLLKDISDGKRLRNNTLALGRYCRAGTYIGIRGT